VKKEAKHQSRRHVPKIKKMGQRPDYNQSNDRVQEARSEARRLKGDGEAVGLKVDEVAL
jgi:hypothetical protein